MKLWAHRDMCVPAGRRSPGSGNHKQTYSIAKLEMYKVRHYDTDKRQRCIWSSYLALGIFGFILTFFTQLSHSVTEEGERVNESCALCAVTSMQSFKWNNHN